MTCTDISNGNRPHYPCTPYEYAHQRGETGEVPVKAPKPPTYTDCHNKDAPATLVTCAAAGLPWGMTTAEMEQHDRNATCATGTQLYWNTHNCVLMPDGKTYNDGSKL